MRLLAVLMGLGMLASVELLLRLRGVSPGQEYAPPRLVHVLENGRLTAEFQATSAPHFVAVGDHIETASAYAAGTGRGFPSGGSMRQERFSPQPAPGTRRYFLLGGSAAVGQNPINPRVPVSWETVDLANAVSALAPSLTIAGQLEALLPGAEVINAGMIAQDSGSVLQIAREVLSYGPDGLILYTGNNEGVGLAYGMQGEEVPLAPQVRSVLRELRLYRLLADRILLARQSAASAQTIRAHGTQPHVLGQMTLAHWQAAGRPLLDGDVPTDPVHAALQRRFAENIGQIVAAARAEGVAVYVLPTPPHLRYPPFFEGHDPSLSVRASRRFMRARQRLDAAVRSGDAAALDAARDAVRLDPAHAHAHHALGEQHAARGEHAAALSSLEAALARDVSRKRSLPSYDAVISPQCVASEGCRHVDLHAALRAEAAEAGLGRYDQLFGDHEHLTPAGCAWVAGHAAALIQLE